MASETNRETGELELRDYLAVLRRRRGIIALTTAAVVAAAVIFSMLQTKVYQASSEVLLQARTTENLFSANQQQPVAQQPTRVQTEIQVMQSRSVRDAVTRKLGHAPAVRIAAEGTTDVVSISSKSTEPRTAARVADTYAKTYVDVRRKALVDDQLNAAAQIQTQITKIDVDIATLIAPLDDLDKQIVAAGDPATRASLQLQRTDRANGIDAQRQSLETRRSAYAAQLDKVQLSSNLTETGGAQIVSAALVPRSPVEPTPRRNAIIALFLGALLGVGVAFLLEYLDDSIRSKEDLDRASGGLDVLGLVPAVEGWKDKRTTQLVSITAPTSAPAEAYRALRTSLQFIGIERPMQLIQMTSPSASEGKTTTLTNLGVALARAGKRVVLVDCDLRRPRLHHFFNMENTVGFTSVLVGDTPLNEALHQVPDQPGLMVLASGPPPPNPSELLSTKRAADVMTSLAAGADFVLVDSPPLLPVADSIVIAGLVNATILVATARTTTKRNLHRAIELLEQVDAPLIGTVLNGVGSESAYGYQYGYRYGQGYGADQQPRRRLPWTKSSPRSSKPATTNGSLVDTTR